MKNVFSRISHLHDTTKTLIWSVLFIEVKQEHVEALITAMESQGLWTEAILNDPDVAALYFVQVSETRIHDAGSFVVRAEEVSRCALMHGATVADWSARDARLSNRA